MFIGTDTKDISTRFIAICDDEECCRMQCRSMVEAYFRKHGQPVEVLEFASTEELMKNEKQIHMVFLDIEMPGLSGIEAKKMLAKTQPKAAIIFMTNYSHYMSEAFGRNVYYFLEKPLKFENVYFAIKQISQDLILKDDYIIVNDKRIMLSQVLYIKGEDKYVRFVIYGKDSVIVRGTMSEWDENLREKGFFRVHKSYIVNFQWVNTIEPELRLKDKGVIPVSRKSKKILKEKYFSFLQEVAY